MGRELVDELVYVDASPRAIAEWLGPEVVDDAWRFDLGRLDAAHAVQITVPAEASELPFELHLVDGDLGWRVTRPGLLPGASRWAGHVTLHAVLSPGDPRWEASDAELVMAAERRLTQVVVLGSGQPVVQRVPEWAPLLRLTAQPSLARCLEAYDRLGIVGIGPRGGFRPMSMVDELALLEAVRTTPVPSGKRAAKRATYQRDAHRMLFERPVRLPDTADPRIGISD